MLYVLTVRRLKPGRFEEFRSAFMGDNAAKIPPNPTAAGRFVRFNLIRDVTDEDTVVTFGMFDGSRDELEATQKAVGYYERRAAADAFVDEVLVNGVFDVLINNEAA